MQNRLLDYPYASKRNVHVAKNGMIATSQPLAAQAGLDMLKNGGNAVDAAIATAAALTVVEPTSNGLGGDAFAIIRFDNKMYGLNGSGKSPAALDVSALKRAGETSMPRFGVLPITTPGAVKAWIDMSERFGALDFETLIEPAIQYAKNGYAASPTLGESWQKAFKLYNHHLKDDVFTPLFDTFSPKGTPPNVGEVVKLQDHAKTLEAIQSTKGNAFYHGEIADKMVAYIQKHGGLLSNDDLARHESEWVTPMKITYKGVNVYELPPNTQGMIALEALKIMEPEPFSLTVDYLHKQIEALKIAFSDGTKYITDLNHMPIKPHQLLENDYIQAKCEKISNHAQTFSFEDGQKGGTVYLATADHAGNSVSFIQSNYMGFGSGVVIPGTGIAMQNRGHGFSNDQAHPNKIAGNKRPYHTIIPGYIENPNVFEGPFGVMGGFMQPQGHMQVVSSLVDEGLNPQSALDKPRWHWDKGRTIQVEQSMPNHIVNALRRKGHMVQVLPTASLFGRGQIILRTPNQVLLGGTEMRTDGHIASY